MLANILVSYDALGKRQSRLICERVVDMMESKCVEYISMSWDMYGEAVEWSGNGCWGLGWVWIGFGSEVDYGGGVL